MKQRNLFHAVTTRPPPPVPSPGLIAQPNRASPAGGSERRGKPDGRPNPSPNVRPKSRKGKRNVLALTRAARFGPEGHTVVSRDLLHLRGGLKECSHRELQINGSARLLLDRRQFLVLFVLICHSLALSGVKGPLPLQPIPGLSAKMILDLIQQYTRQLRFGVGVFQGPDSQAVTRVIGDLHQMFEEIGANRNLITRGHSQWGYRLTAAPHRIWLTLIESGERTKRQWHGRRVR